MKIAVASNTAPRAITKFIPQQIITSVSITSTVIIITYSSIIPPICRTYIINSNMVRVVLFEHTARKKFCTFEL